ncbi:MAG TPA: 16S rRNA (cytosine(1402)-N(4))-methyltransferase RsmH [Hungateiclostridium thermocellum]|uniref:Ribosomal RNA small subunit methyltransferase H n=1 Tax=Acetivibrio thermocellus (strain ATCC 27405 / DSM 1237 / JCM 9322 / NBRC 103400 / NCIMB 10682 / NRRL B-4536 / VPI 7372) TaxID=203119 RepID=RSMH_ACET2|nr:16S rRNA (cytosine(1402)-N(4))-methyltransferase RsmH [Acetivibrio thermocellus]A3DE34.1 RecName: Full=Ribosomal RNA small subunit methyltransferase H; AltName: Full=16S rRNA m(4)C1402 methyltransferase; AltName: Full=rRNA (cytosine-N(4)-)-methyltransferase RsmH [Acetivibrio thermocellus ATCC 27405]ABN52213.1 S-adenosyl-methyltransferase MraW [Acetivibrio thermocellus ATCC 27405]HBW26249.1 16S rRNA (cytosine(1402)-N(4))-methyltransferase RsmH [Acetivibrio thermocellus]
MEFQHKPVLLEETISNLAIKPDGVYIDGTVGGAGHSGEILKRLDESGTLIGLDQDEFAIKTSQEKLVQINSKAKIILVNTNFVNIKEVCQKNNIESVDGILLDLGVSSHQLDEASRGFSYNKDAPLDMRMDRRGELTAKKIVNEYGREEIKRIIRDYGEEKWASRIAEFIVEARKKKEIETTGELVDIIKAAIPSSARRGGPHPAKRTFQALRIAVNNELGILAKTIEDGTELLKPGGRFCIITFHSLEDRIVKDEFNKKVNPCICPKQFPVCTCGRKPEGVLVNRKPIVPKEKELEENPRARSAKLRVLEKI